MRLTADVILRAQVSINPLRERELNLRGYKAPAIENLGVTKDGFDCIDLSDNEIKRLENFPRLRRLRMLLLHNNHVSKIGEGLAEALGSLEYLVLTGNRVAQLAEVDRLAGLTKLDTLTLVGNPVAKRRYYREYVIHKLPQLRVLDYCKIRPRDREAAAMLFNSMIGKQIEQEAHMDAVSESAVTAQTHAMEKVSIAPATFAPPPPPPRTTAPVPAAASTIVATPAPTVASPTPAKEDVEMEEDTSTPEHKHEEKAAGRAEAPSTPPKDVEMESVAAAPAVPFTPSKPIEQLTVTVLREELKKRGLATKGLKAELVKRLKEAVGAP